MPSSPILRAPGPLASVAAKFGVTRVDDEGRHTPWHVLQGNSRFRWYFIGSVTSDFGTWLQNTAQVVLAYQLAHSVLDVGLVTFAQFTSPLVLGPFAGIAADKYGGRRTLLGTQVVGSGDRGADRFDFAGLLKVSILVIGAIIGGLAFTFALPARNVTVQRLVPADRLKPAYAMDTVSYNLGRALAPLLTMTIGLAGVNFAWAFAANSASFIAFSMILCRTSMQGEAKPKRRSKVKDGFRIARQDGRIQILLLMVAAVTFADDPILVLGPALAKQMHAPSAWSGWFIAALGAGTVLGSFRRSKHQPTLRLAATALAALAVFMLIFVQAPKIIPVSAHGPTIAIWIAVGAALGAGASCLIANSVTRAVLAGLAGSEKGGAVMAVWAIAWAGSKPVASLLDGTLGSTIGPQWTGLILAAPALIPIMVVVLLPNVGLRFASLRASRDEEPAVAAVPSVAAAEG